MGKTKTSNHIPDVRKMVNKTKKKKINKIVSSNEATKLNLNLRVRVPLDTDASSAGAELELIKVWKL